MKTIRMPGRPRWTARGALQGNALKPVRDGKTVRVRDGEVLIADGPFAQTKEQIAGFDISFSAPILTRPSKWPRRGPWPDLARSRCDGFMSPEGLVSPTSTHFGVGWHQFTEEPGYLVDLTFAVSIVDSRVVVARLRLLH